eukprot:7382291-Prymnesium_polylepis.2
MRVVRQRRSSETRILLSMLLLRPQSARLAASGPKSPQAGRRPPCQTSPFRRIQPSTQCFS